jgi:hypothetical protein
LPRTLLRYFTRNCVEGISRDSSKTDFYLAPLFFFFLIQLLGPFGGWFLLTEFGRFVSVRGYGVGVLFMVV